MMTKVSVFSINVLPVVYICPPKKESTPLFPTGTVKCTYLAAQQRMLTEISESGAIAKIRI